LITYPQPQNACPVQRYSALQFYVKLQPRRLDAGVLGGVRMRHASIGRPALEVVFASTAIGAVLGGLQVSAIATPTK
jgi:hypothetical protein